MPTGWPGDESEDGLRVEHLTPDCTSVCSSLSGLVRLILFCKIGNPIYTTGQEMKTGSSQVDSVLQIDN
jgi:hypothetical protein